MRGSTVGGVLGAVAAMLAAAGTAAASSLPSVPSGHRPGPDVLYAPPAEAPQLENAAPWSAPPILVSGAAAYRDGEFLYQDYLYDDRGAAGARDPRDPFDPLTFLFSPKRGTLTYPTDPQFANNAADLVELRVKPLADATAFRVTLNTLADPERTAFTIALGSSEDPVAWPHRAGVRSPAQAFLTVHGTTAELLDAASGQPHSPAPTATVDARRRQFDVRVPHAAWDPGTGTVRMRAGVGLWDPAAGSYLVPAVEATATAPGGRSPSNAALFNLAFRFGEPLPAAQTLGVVNTIVEGGALAAADGAWWRERAQADALAAGDVARFRADVDFAQLAAGTDDDSLVPQKGDLNRILASRWSFGQGVDHDRACFIPAADVCEGRFRGQLQPYAVYVPEKPRPERGYGLTFLLHGLSANHNEFASTRHVRQFGERGAGSIVAAPYGRGPDGFYRDYAEGDVFEVWADLARHYALDADWVAVSGYSMGGIGSFQLMARWPDLFARGFPIVGAPGRAEGQLRSLRNIPVLFWNSGQDELVGPHLYEPGRIELDEVGVAYEHWLFNPAAHITLANNDEYGPAADFLGEHRVERDPPHVTYVLDADDDLADAGVVADHAYWLSDLRLRDPDGSPQGTVDALSHGFGLGDPPVSSLQAGGGTLGGTHGALTYASRARRHGEAPAIPRANRVDVSVSGIASATLDVRRARLSCDADVRVASDGPFALRLAGCGRVVRSGATCLPERARVGRSSVAGVPLARTRSQLERRGVRPRRRAARAYRYCVAASRGRVVAVFSSRSRRARARLVTTSARAHRRGRVRPGASARTAARAFPRRRRVARGLWRASPGSRLVYATRRGRVRYLAVADARLLRDGRALRRHLRAAGL